MEIASDIPHLRLTCVTTFRLPTTFLGVAGDNHIIAILRFHGIPFPVRHNAKALIEKNPRAHKGPCPVSVCLRHASAQLMNPIMIEKKPAPNMLSDYMILPDITVAL